jgi:hypothetical protein
MGRYSLIFEPKHKTIQFDVSFDDMGESTVTPIRKYSDTPIGKGKLKKNNLCEIDKITASCRNLEEFFEKFVSPTTFSYSGRNLHKMFIGYMYRGYMHTMSYVINNPKLIDKMRFVSKDGTRINDIYGINSYMDFILEDKDNKFLNFIFDEKQNKNTALTDSTFNLIRQLKSADTNCDYNERDLLRRELQSRLSAYKEYREMFLLHMHYQDKLATDKSCLQELRDEAVAISKQAKQTSTPAPSFEGEQLSLFTANTPVQKKL